MNIDIILAGFDASQIEQTKSVAWLLIGLLAFSAAVGVYNFLQMRKMQKKNRPKPNQLDGTIADEGISFYDLAGSPHVHTNITDIWDKTSQAIKKKSGGILGMGKTSQVTGYRYYAKFAAFIGNRIEKFLAINFDNRGWIVHDPKYYGPNLLQIYEPNLFGENEGGLAGVIDIHTGLPEPEPNPTYQQYFPLVSGYPYQSYLVFRGFSDPIDGQAYAAPAKSSFYLGNSGYMKEMLLWVKRTRVRNDGRGQWYETRQDGAIVCEIGDWVESTIVKPELKNFDIELKGSATLINGAGVLPISVVKSDARGYFDENGNLPSFIISDWIPFGIYGFSEEDQKNHEYNFNLSLVINNIGKAKVIFNIGEGVASGSYSFFTNADSYTENIIDEGVYRFHQYTLIKQSNDEKIILDIEFSKSVAAKIGSEGLLFILLDSITISLEGYSYVQNTKGPDINPIHKIREILTDDTAMGKPETDVNDANFRKAADRIWNEGLGVSWAIDEKSCIDAIEELCYHTEAGVRVNRQTGLYEMVLFRDDWFSEEEIHDITENKIKNLSLEIMNSDDIVNQLNVTYYDRKRIKNSAFSVYENGSILTMGHVNAESVDFPYFMNMRNAEIVANWKLKQFSTPAWSGSFATGWREARKWNRYDLIRLPWSKKWNGTILVRIMKINLGNGTDNTVTIDFEEIVPYSGEMNTSIVADESLNQGVLPPQPCQYEPFELPYYLVLKELGQRRVDDELAYESNFGLVGVVAEKPQSNSIYAIMMTHDGTEDEEWTRAATIDYSPTADLDQMISRTATSFTVKNRKNLTDLPSGTLIKCGSDWIGAPGEFMILQSIDVYTGIITVKRGALDTLPQPWDSNVKLYFCGNEVDFDERGYVLGDEVLVSVLTTTPSGVLEQKGSIPIEMKARAIRPYPPANVKFNGVYFPETHLITRDLTIDWVDRNRLQQTGGELLGFYDAGVVREPGITYSIELIREEEIIHSTQLVDANTYVIPASLFVKNKAHKLKIWTVRDGYKSYQTFEHTFFAEAISLLLTATTDGSKVSGNTIPAASISIDVDTSLKANMRFDGSSISGKAPAGATILIEVEE